MTLAPLMRWAGAPAHADEPLDVRRSRNIVTGIALGFGTIVLSLAAFVLPGWHLDHLVSLEIIAGLVILGAVAHVVLAKRIPAAGTYVTAAAVDVVLPAVQVLVGYPAAVATIGLTYVLTAAIVATYFSVRAVTLFLGGLVAGHMVVVSWPGRAEVLPQIVASAAVSVAVAVLVALLAGHLREQTVTDPLTGLVNRRGLDRLFESALSVAARNRAPMCVVRLDLDQFKKLNDTHGHATGDRVLTDASAAWRRTLRPGDTLARVGGDEFVALLPSCGASEANVVMDRLLRVTPTEVSCSAGAARFAPVDTVDTLLARADTALYRAKARPGSAAVMADGE